MNIGNRRKEFGASALYSRGKEKSMKVSVKERTITVSVQEMVDIIKGRENAAMMDTIMPSGKENPLSVSYNDGVKVMAKYMGDYILNAFDQAEYEAKKNGGEW